MDIYENSESVQKLNTFWEQSKVEISNIKIDQMTFKSQDLPLARIKKIMKLDEDVKSMMISAEAPILFAKAAEFFIREITLRAWIHTERNKRRTLQRSDITLAVGDGDTDQFDFLIDIVPRDEIKAHGSAKREETTHSQPMHQMSGNMNLFSGNTIHLSGQGISNQQTLISGIVDSSNMLQAQANQNISNIQNQQQIQYVLQIPANAQLGGHQTIQVQMIPQQTIMTGGDTTTSTASVLNGTQAPTQQIFTLASGSGGNHSTVVLQPTVAATGQAVFPVSATVTATVTASIAPTITTTTAASSSSSSSSSVTAIKKDQEESSRGHHDGT